MIQQLLINGVIAGSIYGLVALGFNVIYSTLKFFHLAHGVIYTIGAYVAYTVMITLECPLLCSFIIAIIISVLSGICIDAFIYQPLRKRNASNLVLLLASFGVFIFIQNFIQLIYGAHALSLRTDSVKEGHLIFGFIITDYQILIILSSAILLIIILLFFKRTTLGKAMRAVADDPIAASIVGINPDKIIRVSMGLGSGLAAIAGILISFETSIEPSMGFGALLKGIIACIIGGIGSFPGAVLGGLFLGITENLSIWFIPAGWKDGIAFIVLILTLLIRPQGIFGKKIQTSIY